MLPRSSRMSTQNLFAAISMDGHGDQSNALGISTASYYKTSLYHHSSISIQFSQHITQHISEPNNPNQQIEHSQKYNNVVRIRHWSTRQKHRYLEILAQGYESQSTVSASRRSRMIKSCGGLFGCWDRCPWVGKVITSIFLDEREEAGDKSCGNL